MQLIGRVLIVRNYAAERLIIIISRRSFGHYQFSAAAAAAAALPHLARRRPNGAATRGTRTLLLAFDAEALSFRVLGQRIVAVTGELWSFQFRMQQAAQCDCSGGNVACILETV